METLPYSWSVNRSVINSKANKNDDRTHCKHGHPFDAENIKYQIDRRQRKRVCKYCVIISKENWILKKAEEIKLKRLGESNAT